MKSQKALIMIMLFINTIFAFAFPFPKLDIIDAQGLAKICVGTTGLGFYLMSISGEFNCFFAISLIELLIFDIIKYIKRKLMFIIFFSYNFNSK